MVLKYLTRCDMGCNEIAEKVFCDKWNFVGGIISASIYWDEVHKATMAALEFETRPSVVIALHNEAYLLNENGKTIEKIRL